MNEQKLATLSIIATLLLIALAIAACMIVKPAEAVEFTSKPDYTFTVDATDVTNQRVLQEMRLEKLRELHDKLVEKYEARLAEEEAARLAEEQAAWEAEQAALDKAADKLAEFGYVKVVFCKDCEHFPGNCDWCYDDDPDGYCKWGDRRG